MNAGEGDFSFPYIPPRGRRSRKRTRVDFSRSQKENPGYAPGLSIYRQPTGTYIPHTTWNKSLNRSLLELPYIEC